MKYFDHMLGTEIDWKKTGIVLANIVIDYFVPIFLEEEIEVLTKINKIGNKSFEIKQKIVNSLTSEIKSESTSTMVCFNYYLRESIAIPQDWKDRFEKFS
jgi:acyl-CoA thioester hydrolase